VYFVESHFPAGIIKNIHRRIPQGAVQGDVIMSGFFQQPNRQLPDLDRHCNLYSRNRLRSFEGSNSGYYFEGRTRGVLALDRPVEHRYFFVIHDRIPVIRTYALCDILGSKEGELTIPRISPVSDFSATAPRFYPQRHLRRLSGGPYLY